MEKCKDIKNKHYSDTHEKKIGSSNFKNSVQIASKTEHTAALPFFTKSKHSSGPNIKKSNALTGETRSNFKVNSEQYGIKRNSNPIVNVLSVKNGVSKWNLEHCHNFSANIYNIQPSLGNLACPVSEIPQLNGVLKFQSSRHDIPKYAKHKPRSIFSDKRVFNLKNPISNVTIANCKYSSTGNCSDRCHCSTTPWNSQHGDSYINIANYKTVSENIANEDYSLKYRLKYPNSNDFENITDLPIFVHSNFNKDAFELKYSVQRNLGKTSQLPKCNSVLLDETDTMLFPALSSNCHDQIKLNSSNASSVISLDKSVVDSSELVSVLSFPKENSNYSSCDMNTTIPQASYADIIRMPPGSAQDVTATDFKKNNNKNLSQGLNSLQKKPSHIINGGENSDWVNSKLSQSDQNSSEAISVSSVLSEENGQNVSSSNPIVISLKKPSFYNSSLANNKHVSSNNSHTNLISSDTQGLVDGRHINDSSSLTEILSDNVSMLSEVIQTTCVSDNTKTQIKVNGSEIGSASTTKFISDTFQPGENVLNGCKCLKNNNLPVHMNASSIPIMSEISFGIEYEEMIRLCASDSDTPRNSSTVSFQDSDCCLIEKKNSLVASQELSDTKFQTKTTHSTSIAESSNASNQYVEVKSKRIYWSEPHCDQKYNFQQINQYFACVWEEFEKNTKTWKEDEDDDKDDSHSTMKITRNSSITLNS